MKIKISSSIESLRSQVPTPNDSSQSIFVARMRSVSSSPVVLALARLPHCQSLSDENILPRSFLVDGRRPRRQCLH